MVDYNVKFNSKNNLEQKTFSNYIEKIIKF